MLTDLKEAINYNEIYEQLISLNLSIYTPSDLYQIVKSKLYRFDTEKRTYTARS